MKLINWSGCGEQQSNATAMNEICLKVAKFKGSYAD